MARFNEILVGRFNRALQKLTGIKGAASTPVLASEIVPSFSLFWGAEIRYLESWQRFSMLKVLGPVAAQLNIVHFRNPANSNVVAVFEKIWVQNNAGSAQSFEIDGPSPSTSADDQVGTVGFARLDARGQQNPSLIVTSGTAATNTWPGNSHAWFDVQLNTGAPWDVIVTDIQEFPLLPGDGMRISTSPVNLTGTFSVMWRERFLEDSERT